MPLCGVSFRRESIEHLCWEGFLLDAVCTTEVLLLYAVLSVSSSEWLPAWNEVVSVGREMASDIPSDL